ncbi:hypothetical protein C4569_03015 [Candidatus Parcubacteria bacterium]|nr:MAG: hypothetical protein C4569_03015 [Candidatus Parcubacteria bacterium]
MFTIYYKIKMFFKQAGFFVFAVQTHISKGSFQGGNMFFGIKKWQRTYVNARCLSTGGGGPT